MSGALSNLFDIYPNYSSNIGTLIDSAATQYNLNPNMLATQLAAESGFNASASNPSGATGIAQFMPGTAAQYNVDPNNITSSVYGAAQYDAALLASNGGNVPGMLNSYGTGVPGFNAVAGNLGLPNAASYSGSGIAGAAPQQAQAAQTGFFSMMTHILAWPFDHPLSTLVLVVVALAAVGIIVGTTWKEVAA